MPIEWTDKISVGNPAIDDDHKHLIDLINEYEEAVSKKDIRILDHAFAGLEKYAEEHFEREELMMEAMHFPHRRKHQEAHRELIRQVQDKHAQIRQHKHIDIKELSEFLRHWLIDHVLKEDMQIKSYVKGGRTD